jgi:glycosyltransferase involved in cell wall biosynthesis
VGRVGTWGKWRIKRAIERFATSKFQHLFVLSDEDRLWAHELCPEATVRVLRYPAGMEFAGLPRREVPGRILFVGALNRIPNLEALQWFVGGCWPRIRGQCPDAEFHIVGRGLPEMYGLRWSADPAIKIIGPVESVESHYSEAAVFIAPILTGGGIIVKVLDGLAAGVPVVTTTRGNEGIGADATAVLIADTPDAFASSVIRLLKDESLREAVGDRGRQYAKRKFSPVAFTETLNETYAEMTDPCRSAGVSGH